jgi:hypothetical protein
MEPLLPAWMEFVLAGGVTAAGVVVLKIIDRFQK